MLFGWASRIECNLVWGSYYKRKISTQVIVRLCGSQYQIELVSERASSEH